MEQCVNQIFPFRLAQSIPIHATCCRYGSRSLKPITGKFSPRWPLVLQQLPKKPGAAFIWQLPHQIQNLFIVKVKSCHRLILL